MSLAACPIHDWRPPRGPGGNSAKGLCPGCTVARDLASGRTALDDEGQPKPAPLRVRDPAKRVHRHYGLVSDGPPVDPHGAPTPLADQLWSGHLARNREATAAENKALMTIDSRREAEKRRNSPGRGRRVRSATWADGAWQVDYQPPRRDARWEIDVDEAGY